MSFGDSPASPWWYWKWIPRWWRTDYSPWELLKFGWWTIQEGTE